MTCMLHDYKFLKKSLFQIFIKVSSLQSLIQNYLSFILFWYIEKNRYETLPITNIMSILFSSTGTYTAIWIQPKTFSPSIVLSECFPMGAITFTRGIPNAKMFGSVTHSICIYCVSITNFNRIYFVCFTLSFFLTKFFLRIGSIVSTTAFCSIWLDF